MATQPFTNPAIWSGGMNPNWKVKRKPLTLQQRPQGPAMYTSPYENVGGKAMGMPTATVTKDGPPDAEVDISGINKGNPDSFTSKEQLTTGQELLGLAGRAAPAALFGANVLSQYLGNKKIRDRKKALQPRMLNPVSTRIAPVRQLPSEVSDAYLNQIANEEQTTSTADPTQALIEKQMKASRKRQSLEKLTGMQAQYATQDRQRFDAEIKQQQTENIQRGDENQFRLMAKDKADMVADVQYTDKNAQLAGAAITGVQQGVHNQARDKFAANQMDRQNLLTGYNDQLSSLQLQLDNLDMSIPSNYSRAAEIRSAMSPITEKRKKLMRTESEQSKPGYIRERTFLDYPSLVPKNPIT